MVKKPMDAHEFHIPVMGTGFTIDTPLHVARYGISSAVSLVDDTLIEQMRKHYAGVYGRSFEPIKPDQEDARALRIQAYLDLVAEIVAEQVRALQASAFEPGSEITRYFSLLPNGALRRAYEAMLICTDEAQKKAEQERLRGMIAPGGIDVNIMTKLDRLPHGQNGKPLEPQFSDAIAALRGFAMSKAKGGMVFSAGLNAPLYTAVSQYDDFLPNAAGESCKTVILKVSDYRSAAIQGRFLAKRGIWVSEFRVESGLHCGGHAFATQGYLLGPILAEFQQQRTTLQESLHRDYSKALSKKGMDAPKTPRRMAVTVQGGVATHEEHQTMLSHYGMDRTGWGTPFLLVPEVTSLDDEHIQLLMEAGEGDVVLSDSSPLGVPFWTLKTSSSERVKHKRIAEGKPGSGCPKGYLAFPEAPNSQCKASHQYQSFKLAQIDSDANTGADAKNLLKEQVLAKACICHELGGGVLLKHGISKNANTSICPSLSILPFNAAHTLEEMVGHIYGRWSLFKSRSRPHMFIQEIAVYIDYLCREVEHFAIIGSARNSSYYVKFKQNLLEGITYYQQSFQAYFGSQREKCMEELRVLRSKLDGLVIEI